MMRAGGSFFGSVRVIRSVIAAPPILFEEFISIREAVPPILQRFPLCRGGTRPLTTITGAARQEIFAGSTTSQKAADGPVQRVAESGGVRLERECTMLVVAAFVLILQTT
jgi:hypothetical protein